MLVLVTAWGWPSHLHALVPFAWACRTAGHDVLLAVQPGLVPEAARSGLPVAEVGTDVDSVAFVAGYLMPTARQAGGGAPRTGGGPRALQMFLANAEAMAPDLVELARAVKPDVVVHEPTAFAGPLAAAAVGIPAVCHRYGVDLLPRARAMLPGLLAPLAARLEVTGPVDPLAAPTIDPVPAALQHPAGVAVGSGGPVVHPVRHLPYGGPAPRDPDLRARGTRPRVCVTWGHTLGRIDPARCLTGRVAAAVAGLDVEVLALVSSRQAAALGSLPDGVTVAVDSPLEQALDGADLVVAHGGAGTILTALGHDVPLLLVPQLPDHAGHAARVFAAGAGDVLSVDEANPARLHAEVRRLLQDPAPRAGARRLGAAIRSAPSPAEIASQLASIAAQPTPGTAAAPAARV